MHGRSRGWNRRTLFEDMDDRAAVAVARVDHLCIAAFPAKPAGIAGLAATHRVEHGPVEDYAVFVDGSDGCVTVLEIRVLAEEFFGHAKKYIARRGGLLPAGC